MSMLSNKNKNNKCRLFLNNRWNRLREENKKKNKGSKGKNLRKSKEINSISKGRIKDWEMNRIRKIWKSKRLLNKIWGILKEKRLNSSTPKKKHKDKFWRNSKEDSMSSSFKSRDNFNNKIRFIKKLNCQEIQVHHQSAKHLHKLPIQKDSIPTYRNSFSRRIGRDRWIDIKTTRKYNFLLTRFRKWRRKSWAKVKFFKESSIK